VSADPKTIHHSLLNLINNAIDACLEDLDVSKSHEVSVKTYIDQKSRICFEIKDNGCGMEEETRKKLFTPMFSSKGGKGTGLGLLVTKKLIEEHNGDIDIVTSPGIGSTFTVGLPYEKAKMVDIS
jgi:signal transduction histidine kinase